MIASSFCTGLRSIKKRGTGAAWDRGEAWKLLMSPEGKQCRGRDTEWAVLTATSFINSCLEKASFHAVHFRVIIQISLLLVLKRHPILLL